MIVDGLHDGIITEDLYYQVQIVLSGKRKAVNRPRINNQRVELPLRGHLFCPTCKKKMTGSRSRGNGGQYFYYHCNSCRQVRIKAEKLNKSYIDLLAGYKISSEYNELFLKIFMQRYKQEQKDNTSQMDKIAREVKTLHSRLDNLDDKLTDNLIEISDYNRMKSRYTHELQELKMQKAEEKVRVGELEKDLKNVLNLMENIDNLYTEAPVEVKQRMIGSIFPGNLEIVDERVRTTEVNEAMELICNNSKALGKAQQKKLSKNEQLSRLVAGTGFEPMTFGL
ncbi:MAG: zinc ribbon domain-containing protein [Bacteroidales bacterium]|nr:zinc ribbon domain-containing protein [Bacteroidales bacterium]